MDKRGKRGSTDIPGVYEKGFIVAVPGSRVSLPLAVIDNNPNQPRRYFNKASITRMAMTFKETSDVDMPIGVSVAKNRKRAIIVYGERRWRAAHIADLPFISCYIQEEMSEIMLFKKSLRENVLREPMSPVEEALAYKRVMDEEGLTAVEIAEEYGHDLAMVYELLRYLKLDPTIQDMVINRQIEKGSAKLLTSYAPNHQVKLIKCLTEEKKKKGGPLTQNEALMVIRKSAEGFSMKTAISRGKRQRSHTELVARSLMNAAVHLGKAAGEFSEIDIERLVAMTEPNLNEVRDQLEYVARKVETVRKLIAPATD